MVVTVNPKQVREELKMEIDQIILDILNYINEYDPIELLSCLSINQYMEGVKNNSELYEKYERYLEYLQSLMLSINKQNDYKEPTDEINEILVELLDKLFEKLNVFFFIDTSNKLNETEKEIRFVSLMNYINVRGDSYPEHHLDMITDLFKVHETFFKKNYNISPMQIIKGHEDISYQIYNNIRQYYDRQKQAIDLNNELTELYNKFLHDNEYSHNYSIHHVFLKIPGNEGIISKYLELLGSLNINIFEIKTTQTLTVELLNQLSLQIGDNEDFSNVKNYKYWPTNDSLIYDFPLIKHDEKYYCISHALYFRNMGNILENLIKEYDKANHTNYYNDKFTKTRGKYIENRGIEYIEKILNNAKVYKNLFYDSNSDGETKDVRLMEYYCLMKIFLL